MRRFITLFAALCLLVLLIPRIQATQPPKIADSAGLLTAQQVEALETKAQKLTDTYSMDVVIVTVPSLGGKSAEDFADDYFDSNGYGIGFQHSGILFLISMEYHDWAFSTTGNAIYAFTDYGTQILFGKIAPDLSEGRYYQAFDLYLDTLDTYFKAYDDGEPIDGKPGDYNGPGTFVPGTGDDVVHFDDQITFLDVLKRFGIALLIGAAVGGIVLLVLRGQMNTVRSQSGARSYMKADSFDLYRRQDIFLYSRTTKMRKPDPNSSSRGGGSSIHRSSSGRSHGGSHGGSHGKF